MRELSECRAEVFRRSDNRIKERKRNRNRILTMGIPLCLVVALLSVTVLPGMWSAGSDRTPYKDTSSDYAVPEDTVSGDCAVPEDAAPNATADPAAADDTAAYMPDNFSFCLTWNTYGISSYDSATGKLVKTTDATNPEDYITTLHLDSKQLLQIGALLRDLDMESYPEEYDPHAGTLESMPSMTLILTLRSGGAEKTVRAQDIALTYESGDPKGQKFLDVCKEIRDILTATQEWQALPEYEFIYD